MCAMNVQNDRNRGLWTVGGTLAGAGVGVGTAAIVKPYLKKGVPTASFAQRISEDVFYSSSEVKDVFKKVADFNVDLKKVTDKKGLWKFIKSKSLTLSKDVKVQIGKAESLEKAKVIVSECFQINQSGALSKICEDIIEKFGDGGDIYKTFMEKKDTLSKEMQESVERTIKNVKFKTGLLYGSIGALVVGLMAFILSKKKDS